MTINKERVGLGVAALRSGDFEQGKEMLRCDNHSDSRSFCCLGVMTEVAIANGLEGIWWDADEQEYRFRRGCGGDCGGSHGENGALPPLVMDWYGFTVSDPALKLGDGRESTAIHCNDDEGLFFDEIADAFERTYLSD